MFLASSTIVPLFQAGIIGRVLFTVALAYITPNQVEFIALKWGYNISLEPFYDLYSLGYTKYIRLILLVPIF